MPAPDGIEHTGGPHRSSRKTASLQQTANLAQPILVSRELHHGGASSGTTVVKNLRIDGKLKVRQRVQKRF